MLKSNRKIHFAALAESGVAGHGLVEIFESAVDLFTVLSLALIIASFVFGIQQVKNNRLEKTAEMTFQQVSEGTGTAVGIPEEYKVITLVNVGKKADVISRRLSDKQIEWEKHRPKRKLLEEFVFKNKY